jgi:pantothenate kinase
MSSDKHPSARGSAAGFELPVACLERAYSLIAQGGRRILGLVAPPGAGKSTLAQGLAAALGDLAQVVPMDGFHLSNAALQKSGRLGRKGAPDTFDAAGYLHLLQRLRQQPAGETIYAPEYLRSFEEGIAGSIAVQAATPLIITEGNYLLMQDGPWAQVRGLLDEAWYLEIDDALRESWLLARHMQFGKTYDQARAWIATTDAPNAIEIAKSGSLAHWRVPPPRSKPD